MRLLLALVIIFSAVVGLGLWTNELLEDSTADLLIRIDSTADSIVKDDWAGARKEALSLENKWEKTAGWWPILLDHQEMDNIEFSMARVREYVSSQNAALSLGQISELREMIKHIPEKEAVTIENIL